MLARYDLTFQSIRIGASISECIATNCIVLYPVSQPVVPLSKFLTSTSSTSCISTLPSYMIVYNSNIKQFNIIVNTDYTTDMLFESLYRTFTLQFLIQQQHNNNKDNDIHNAVNKCEQYMLYMKQFQSLLQETHNNDNSNHDNNMDENKALHNDSDSRWQIYPLHITLPRCTFRIENTHKS